MAFQGFTDAASEFFIQIRLNNHSAFFEENRSAFESSIKEPLLQLADALVPTVLEIDSALDMRPGRVLSRIRRDTRFSKDKRPYRDNMWLCWRHTGPAGSKLSLPGLYFNLQADTYDIGCGFYEAPPVAMRALRERILAAPNAFLSVADDPKLRENFNIHFEEYKKPKIPAGADERVLPWLRAKGFYLERQSRWDQSIYTPGFVDEVAEYLKILGPLFRIMTALPVE